MKTGEDLFNKAITYIGCKYVLGILVPKNNENYRGAFDCAEFVSYIIYQVAGIPYGWANDKGDPSTADAYTGFFARDAQQLGITITVEEAIATKGAALLRIAGNGVIGHIVFSDGAGGTMEANSTKLGLIKSTALGRRWSIGIKIPGIQYTTGAPVDNAPTPDIVFLTDPFMAGQKVAAIQQALLNKGFEVIVDGKYGPGTAAVVKAFQSAHGLVPDGEVGPQTATLLGISL
jgi:N-acetylmuramoyl-L-alanine amidase